VKKYSQKTRKFFIGCTGYPECNFVEAVKENLGDCPECGRPLIRRYSRKTRRYFIGCSGYPDCKYIAKQKKK
jgi:ssDNA-binding Zn-finger/Zn-ribbon topoisomerase 1